MSKCFEKLEAGEKITISKLDSWVKEYLKKSLECISESVVFDLSPSDGVPKRKIRQNLPNKFSKKIKKPTKLPKFSPIVLTAPIKNTNQQIWFIHWIFIAQKFLNFPLILKKFPKFCFTLPNGLFRVILYEIFKQ